MHTNLTKIKGKWAVEIFGGPDEEVLIKTFPAGREQAANWLRDVNAGNAPMPTLKSKQEAPTKPKVSTKKK